MVNIPTEIIKIARPVHWVKNLALFAALIFSRNLGSEFLFEKVVIGFIAFCLATSSAYIFNDILDVVDFFCRLKHIFMSNGHFFICGNTYFLQY
ncbi:MAG: hypothetical protein US53_C0029G0006 [Candidatus Woesebacteria bacterium GW2011_GWA1_37_7]|uniref:Decaprenyl-phosphate phosphoribosyltransferase n=1 Tax=Candidatus Woesebacteria bacterium GW2011_GWA1_37_7 TaxID=1618545 RepID=A0A0G0H4H7_9BACT|nr:MAG: hypothetical protein US53_C0029G0006 [Candidatus Woesebacteria bacterium GW2011_GWA1_37_7]